ncbi:MAG: hypothetical protein R3C18_22065 [Planctomycetaceae bacterium]
MTEPSPIAEKAPVTHRRRKWMLLAAVTLVLLSFPIWKVATKLLAIKTLNQNGRLHFETAWDMVGLRPSIYTGPGSPECLSKVVTLGTFEHLHFSRPVNQEMLNDALEANPVSLMTIDVSDWEKFPISTNDELQWIFVTTSRFDIETADWLNRFSNLKQLVIHCDTVEFEAVESVMASHDLKMLLINDAVTWTGNIERRSTCPEFGISAGSLSLEELSKVASTLAPDGQVEVIKSDINCCNSEAVEFPPDVRVVLHHCRISCMDEFEALQEKYPDIWCFECE